MASLEEQRARAEAKAKAERALKAAQLRRADTTTAALRKLDKAMSKAFGKNYDTKLTPLGIVLSQKAPRARRIAWTATGTIRCRFSRLRCGFDVDG